jgi:cold shock protein
MGLQEKVNVDFDGTLLWFRDDLGYGFIQCSSLPKPIYVHYSRIITDEKFKTLSKGQFVLFQIAETEKGLMAVNVREKKVIRVKAEIMPNESEPKL